MVFLTTISTIPEINRLKLDTPAASNAINFLTYFSFINELKPVFLCRMKGFIFSKTR